MDLVQAEGPERRRAAGNVLLPPPDQEVARRLPERRPTRQPEGGRTFLHSVTSISERCSMVLRVILPIGFRFNGFPGQEEIHTLTASAD